ncbi:hypothetical protein LguiB_021870 [Lonicera macranthoides]
MDRLYFHIHYWLVDHPTISQFEWKKGHTFGSSPLFLTLTVLTYISLTYILLPTPRAATLRRISAIHNLLLIFLSFLMAVGGILSALSMMPHHRWIFFFPTNQTPPRGLLFFWAQVFYLSKLLEFTDTALIVLGGTSNRRLSFLHVYHHALVVVMSYRWLYTSQSLLVIGMVLNATVHVMMYGYYFLCTIGRRPSWKRWVTDCQIIQFLLAFSSSCMIIYYHFTGDGCSGMLGWAFNIVFDASLLVLFANFTWRVAEDPTVVGHHREGGEDAPHGHEEGEEDEKKVVDGGDTAESGSAWGGVGSGVWRRM